MNIEKTTLRSAVKFTQEFSGGVGILLSYGFHT